MENPKLIDEFINLCGNNLTFVNDWNDSRIPASSIRLYSKKVPVNEATKQFSNRVRRLFHTRDLREKLSEDVEKSRFSHEEWNVASDFSSIVLDQKAKEPRSLLFFKGAIYLCTFNEKNEAHSQSQMAFLFDLPDQESLDRWQKIKILVAPPGLKFITYDPSKSKEEYLNEGFQEVKISIAQEYVHSAPNDLLVRRKQYGLKHYVSLTIHAAMGDTLPSMATTISSKDSNYHLWDKGQLVVILSRTKFAKDSIFVGSKEDTLKCFREVLLRKTQWTDYIEDVLEITTINNENTENFDNEVRDRVFYPTSYPFVISDYALPTNNSGYVYMLVSRRHQNFAYIGTTSCIRTRLNLHNSGVGAKETAPAHLRPFALFAYICGFNGFRSDLRFLIEEKWKKERDYCKSIGIQDPRRWALSIRSFINFIEGNRCYGVAESKLTLICLFSEI